MSLLVVGLSHRTAPVSLLERARGRRRRASRDAGRAAARGPRQRGAGAVHLQPGGGLRGGRPVPRRPAGRLHRAGQPGRPGRAVPGRAPVRALRGRGRAAPVLGGGRARLDGRRRVADPRPAARRRTRRRPTWTRSTGSCTSSASTPCGPASGCTRRPASTGPAPRSSRSGWSEAERVLGPLPGKRALVIGAGSMGALSAATLARAGIGELVDRQPVPAAGRAAGRAARWAGPRGAAGGRAGRAARRRPGRRLHRRGRHRAGRDDGRGGVAGTRPTGRWCCSTSRCRGTSTAPPASCPACTTWTWPRCRSRRSGSARTGTWSGRGRSSARRSPAGSAPAGPPRSPRR